MAEYQLSSRASTDINEIAKYTIETFGIRQARRYRDGLEACFQTLATTPNLGREATQLAPNLKRYTYQSHEVFYMVTKQEVLIVRILHERMDFDRHL